MGTRSLTIFEGRAEIAVLYRQFDGYPHNGHGQELAEFLAGFRIVNGIGARDSKLANGLECLAAQAVAHFKSEPGHFYLYPAGTRDCGEEFRYTVYGAPGMEPKIRAEAVWLYDTGEHVELLFDGQASEMLVWLNEPHPGSASHE